MNDSVDYYADSWETNDNDTHSQANGPIHSDFDYYGYPEDTKDYYYFIVKDTGNIAVDVKGYVGPDPQIQLQYFSQDNQKNLIDFCWWLPCHIDYTITPEQVGTYYVYLSSAYGVDSNLYYTLTVSYPVLPTPAPSPPNTYLIIFDTDKKIYSNGTEEDAETEPVNITIPPGNYQVSLASYDNHDEQAKPEQPDESWHLELFSEKNGLGVLVATSESSRDMPTETDCFSDVVDVNLNLPQTVKSVIGVHAAYTPPPMPTNPSPNSVAPASALFEVVSGSNSVNVIQTPNATPILLPTRTPTPTPMDP